jgi:hypothetical protein
VIVLGESKNPSKDVVRYAMDDVVADRRGTRFVYINAKTFSFSAEKKVKWPYHLDEYPKVFYTQTGPDKDHV